jgi:hypothetical protein
VGKEESLTPAGFGWRRLQILGALIVALSSVVHLLLGGDAPLVSLLVVTVFPLIGLVLVRFARRVGVIWLGVFGLLIAVVGALILTDIANVAEARGLVPASMLAVGGLIAAASAIPAFRGPRAPDTGSPAAGWLAVAAVVLLVLVSAGSIVARSVGFGCDANELRVYFWPEGHGGGEIIPGEEGIPDYPQPHIELFVGEIESGADDAGVVSRGEPDCTEKRPTGGLSVPQGLTEERRAVRLTCENLQSITPRMTDSGVRPAVIEVEVDERVIVALEVRSQGSSLHYDPAACTALQIPNTRPS